MATKDITDLQVVTACKNKTPEKSVPEVLAEMTGQPIKVCMRAIERAVSRDLVDYGTSINRAFMTPIGVQLYNLHQSQEKIFNQESNRFQSYPVKGPR